MSRKTLLLGLCIMISPWLKGQHDDTVRDSMLYAIAYDYILVDSVGKNNSIIPSNRLVPTSYLWFLDDIGKTNNKVFKVLTSSDYERIPEGFSLSDSAREQTALHLKVQSLDEKSINDSTIFPTYTFPASYVENGNRVYTLNFSPVFDNEFFVELNLPPAYMGGQLIYLFIFNSDQTIKEILFTEVHGL